MNPNRFLFQARSFLLALLSVCALSVNGTSRAVDFFGTGANAVTGVDNSNNPLTIDLGLASGGYTYRWAILSISKGVTITDPMLFATFADSVGDVGLGGLGVLSMNDGRIQGNLYLAAGASQNMTGTPVITGSTNQTPGDNAALVAAINSATTASLMASQLKDTPFASLLVDGLAPTAAITNIALNNIAMSITGLANATTVLHLQDLILAGTGAILTLNGSSTSNFVINVSRYFILNEGARIVLAGGLQPQNVLFNIEGLQYAYDVILAGGSRMSGIILAPNRNVKLTGASRVLGEVIAKGVSLSGASQVKNDFPTISP